MKREPRLTLTSYGVSRGFASGRYRWRAEEYLGCHLISLASFATRKEATACAEQWERRRGPRPVRDLALRRTWP